MFQILTFFEILQRLTGRKQKNTQFWYRNTVSGIETKPQVSKTQDRINSLAVEEDSWITFSLYNILKTILHPTL